MVYDSIVYHMVWYSAGYLLSLAVLSQFSLGELYLKSLDLLDVVPFLGSLIDILPKSNPKKELQWKLHVYVVDKYSYEVGNKYPAPLSIWPPEPTAMKWALAVQHAPKHLHGAVAKTLRPSCSRSNMGYIKNVGFFHRS